MYRLIVRDDCTGTHTHIFVLMRSYKKGEKSKGDPLEIKYFRRKLTDPTTTLIGQLYIHTFIYFQRTLKILLFRNGYWILLH